MAKRGRKPNPNKKNWYFNEPEEQAVVDYLKAQTKEEKNRIFNDKLRFPFGKMVESIIRRYKLYISDEEYDTTYNDTMSNLITKMDKFRPGCISFRVVEELPKVLSADPNVIYLIKHKSQNVVNSTASDIYDEHILIEVKNGDTNKKVFEKIGITDIDLSEKIGEFKPWSVLFKVVEELPKVPSAEFNIIYLIKQDKLSSTVYDEYTLVTVGDVKSVSKIFENIGTTDIDLSEKIGERKPVSKTKAYSYYGTICKNYLINRTQKKAKDLKKTERYDVSAANYTNNVKYSESMESTDVACESIDLLIKKIGYMLENPEQYELRDSEIKMGESLKNLLEHWDFVLTTDGSRKLNKNAILLFLRDSTHFTTKEVRDNMKKFKKEFYDIKNYLIS